MLFVFIVKLGTDAASGSFTKITCTEGGGR